jgi:hypothetical protein
MLSSAINDVLSSPGCPKGERESVEIRQSNLLNQFEIPLGRSVSLEWECALSCYDAVH